MANNSYIYKDYPEFRPNITPYEVFRQGSFGGTYFREIKSNITGKTHKNRHLKYKLKSIDPNLLTRSCKDYDICINKYGVKVGVDIKNECGLRYWEKKGWINEKHPFGWFEWWIAVHEKESNSKEYNDYQVKRWMGTVGPKGRFRIWLYNKMERGGGYGFHNDSILKLAQICLHWGHLPNKKDYNKHINSKYI